MSGKKGRSGRRPISIEIKRREIINKAWAVYEQGLDSSLPLKVKMENAAKIVVKDMPTQIEGDMKHFVQMPVIKIDDEPLEYNIGQRITETA